MHIALRVLSATATLLAFSPCLVAQQSPRPSREAHFGILDFRIGAMWPGRETPLAEANTRFNFGMRFAPYLGDGHVTRRLSAQIAVDYNPVSRTDFFDPVLGNARLREEIVLVNPALGFDVVQASQLHLTVRYGGAGVANLTRLELPNIYGEYQNVCNLAAFRGACPSRWGFVGNAGAALRIFPKQGFPLYFGVDYTRYAALKNQLVGIVGFLL